MGVYKKYFVRMACLGGMASGLSGCDELFKASPIVNDRTYIFDAVKGISQGDGGSFDDAARFTRASYVVSPDDRLLIGTRKSSTSKEVSSSTTARVSR
jgi:hypothetical protein